MRRALLLLAAAVPGGLLSVAGLTAVTPAEAATSGRCAGEQGVSVVVDFGPLAGGTDVVCVPGGGGDTAAQVTVDSGHPLTFTARQPFVCRISGQPAPEREDCNDTPPEDAYWALFWSDGKSGWRYSTEGATSLKLKDGWSVGWRFQDGGARDLPSAAPRKAASPSPSPTPSSSTPRPTTSPRPGSSTPRPGAASTAPQQSVTSTPTTASPSAKVSPRRTPSASAEPSATTATPSATEDPTGSVDAEESAEASEGSLGTIPADDSGPGNDTGLAAVAGLGGLSLLAGSAAVVAYRRNRT